MTDVIKIYRGIDEVFGEDCLFAVRQDGACAPASYNGHNSNMLTKSYNFVDGYAYSEAGLSYWRKNPTLVREVRK